MTEKQLKEKNFVSAVIYVHNSAAELKNFIPQVESFFSDHFLKHELIFVNDASEDESVNVIKEISNNYGGVVVTVLNMSYFQGLEKSMTAGVDLAIGDYIFEFDSPLLSFDIDIIGQIYDHCLKGFDIVTACPKNSSHATSKHFYSIFNRYSNLQYDLQTESFRILSRRAVNRIYATSKTIPYRKAVYANCGLPMDVVYYSECMDIPAAKAEERSANFETAQDALLLYTNLGYKVSMSFSVLMIVSAILAGFYACIVYITGRPVAGWTTTMLFLSVGFFGISMILTILVKYASLILKTVFNRQKYIIKSIDKLT